MKTMTIRDRLLSIANDAMSLAEGMKAGRDDVFALDALRGMVPAARITSYQAKTGRWYANLIMPDGWRPTSAVRSEETGWWIYDDSQDHYWEDFGGETKIEALRKAFTRLVELADA